MNELFLRELALKEDCPEKGYPFGLPAVRSLARMKGMAFHMPVTFFAGENGTGKSTLLEAIAVSSGFNAEGGTRNFNFSTNETHSCLYEQLRLVRGIRRPKDGFFLRAESFYTVASEVERLQNIGAPTLYQSYGGDSLHHRSHGEGMFALIRNRFSGQGLYLLDEPETALSTARQFALLREFSRLEQSGSQLLIATHSPVLLSYPGAEIYVFSEDGIEQTAYEQTEAYQLTRYFLNHYREMQREIFAEP